MVQDIILTNIIGDAILIVGVWALTTSIKAWATKMINDQTLRLQVKLDEITQLVAVVETNHKSLKTKITTLNHDVEKMEKKTSHIIIQLSTINCLRGKCENIN